MDSNGAPKKKSLTQSLVAILASLGALLAYVAVLGAVSIAFGVVIRLANPGATEEKITELTYSYATLSGIIGNVVAALLLFVILIIIKRKIAPTISARNTVTSTAPRSRSTLEKLAMFMVPSLAVVLMAMC